MKTILPGYAGENRVNRGKKDNKIKFSIRILSKNIKY